MPAGHRNVATAPLPRQASAVVPAEARAGVGGTAAGRLAAQPATAAKQVQGPLAHCGGSWQTRPVAAAGRQAPTAVQQQLVYARGKRLPDARWGPQQQPNAPGQAAGGRNVT